MKVVGGKYKERMGVVVHPTEKMYYIRLDSHEEVRLIHGFKCDRRKKGDNWKSIVHSFEAADATDKIVVHLKCARKSNAENGDTRVIEVAEKISNELCLIGMNLEAVVELLKNLNVNIYLLFN